MQVYYGNIFLTMNEHIHLFQKWTLHLDVWCSALTLVIFSYLTTDVYQWA